MLRQALSTTAQGELYVSQISGEGDKKDGVGVVSHITPDGHVLMMEWISGLNAPKGSRFRVTRSG